MQIIRSLAFTLVLLGLVTLSVSAQPGVKQDIRYGRQLYMEAVQLPSDSAGYARVDVLLRVSYDFMIFTRTEKIHPDSVYGGGVEISMHARRDGQSVHTANHFASVYSANYESTAMRDQYLLFRQTFYLEAGAVEFLVSVSDKKSTRQRSLRRTLAVADLLKAHTMALPVPLDANAHPGSDGVYSVLGYDGTLPFASPGFIGIPVTRGMEADWVVTMFYLDEDGEEEGEALAPDNLQPLTVLRDVTPDGEAGLVDGYDLVPGTRTSSDLVVLKLPIEKLDIGPYLLRVSAKQGERKDSVSFRTSIYWRNMPYSLRDIDFAIDVMRYILTEEEYDRMKSGNQREMMQHFRAYWRELDTTPETEYNEMMTEYFLRVDETIDRFQTLFERNGAFTDRGKVYILFGAPDETQRSLNSDEPAEEIWYYTSLGKTFRFIDRNKNGDYKLFEE